MIKLVPSKLPITTNSKEFQCISCIKDFLSIHNFEQVNNSILEMSSFNLNDRLLVPYNQTIRNSQIIEHQSFLPEGDKTKIEGIQSLHKSLYGESVISFETVKISTTTALIINKLLDNEINQNSYIIFQPIKKNGRENTYEFEIVFFDWYVNDILYFYCSLCAYVLKKDINIGTIPTYFTWSSIAIKIFNSSNIPAKFGALGYIRNELLINTSLEGKKICILGLPIKSFSTILAN